MKRKSAVGTPPSSTKSCSQRNIEIKLAEDASKKILAMGALRPPIEALRPPP
jgi:hypothetical protein